MSIGIWQVVLVLAIVLIIFGAGKLPRVMGDVAKGIKSFKSGMKNDSTETAEAPKALKTEAAPAAEEAAVKKDEAAQS